VADQLEVGEKQPALAQVELDQNDEARAKWGTNLMAPMRLFR